MLSKLCYGHGSTGRNASTDHDDHDDDKIDNSFSFLGASCQTTEFNPISTSTKSTLLTYIN